ncbi:MAG: hypothetical protein EA367_03965 [Leptolyngbya sp. DLM2.Bin15]|nr:MAG: hypothetical protein EA367_03965 [Leptolyngbya sp. DLM2.Bin15]
MSLLLSPAKAEVLGSGLGPAATSDILVLLLPLEQSCQLIRRHQNAPICLLGLDEGDRPNATLSILWLGCGGLVFLR